MSKDSSHPVLSLHDVRVSYGRTEVVKGITFDVKPGETYGFMGLNGAGKTTLIKAILGLHDHKGGTIEIDGQDNSRAESKRVVAYLPERFDPPWFLKGREFVRFSCSLYKRVPADEEIDRLAERLSLDPAVLKNRVQTYSKGMRQKLGLLATLLTGCPFLILDEPMSGLDPRARACVKDVLRHAKEEGRTFFLSSHILADMDEICDRVGVLHEGVLAYTGTPADLRKSQKEDNLEQAFLRVIEAPVAA